MAEIIGPKFVEATPPGVDQVEREFTAEELVGYPPADPVTETFDMETAVKAMLMQFNTDNLGGKALNAELDSEVKKEVARRGE